MLVIGSVKMLNFSKENGDLGGLNLIFFSTGTFALPAPFFLERNLSKFHESFDEIR